MITQEQVEIFQHVCFGVLFATDNGMSSKTPKYIAEKMIGKNSPMAAYQMLHPSLRAEVCRWADGWQFPIDELLKEIGLVRELC